jgi:hypothetical protein
MNNEEASYEIWKNAEDKTVIFLPMVHAGKPAFYENVKNLITQYKEQGYVVFYEGLKFDKSPDTVINPDLPASYISYSKMHFPDSVSRHRLIYILKFKRMIGIIADSTSYVNMLKRSPLTRKAVFQPSVASLGISTDDTNVDVSVPQLVDEYENKFGIIELEQIDFAIPLHEPLPNFRRLKKKNASKLIIDYRDDNLSHSIQSTSSRKIMVIYGLAHKKGTFKELKEYDPSWKLVKSY